MIKQGLRVGILIALGMGPASGDTVSANAVVSEVSADLTGDGRPDRAQLVSGSDGSASLVLDTGDQRIVVPGVASVGGPPPEPLLRLSETGSLQLITENKSVGRNRWSQMLTLAWRDGDLMLAGFTYLWYDAEDAETAGLCDMNLLTGRGVLSTNDTETKVTQPAERLPVTEWDRSPPLACGLN